LRDVLLARLDRYLIADDVELGDESDQWHVAHTLAPPTPGEFLRWTTTRLATPGSDLFAPRAIALAGFADRDEEAFLRACTVAGVPTWDRELTPGLLPPDAGLDDTAVSYEKGCYLGQEVISRMKRAGKTNQHLVVLRLPTGTPAGSTLLHDGREAGRVTSVAESRLSDQETPGLGFRARKFAELAEFTVCHPDGTMPPGTAKARPA
jgi:folate-binding protein YgfZ